MEHSLLTEMLDDTHRMLDKASIPPVGMLVDSEAMKKHHEEEHCPKWRQKPRITGILRRMTQQVFALGEELVGSMPITSADGWPSVAVERRSAAWQHEYFTDRVHPRLSHCFDNHSNQNM